MNRQKLAVVIMAGLFALVLPQIAFPQVQTESQITKPTIVVFYEEGCPDCQTMDDILTELVIGHEDLVIARYEINDPGALDLLSELAAHYELPATRVPIIFVGDEAIVGAGRAEEFRLRAAVDDCATLGCPSPLSYVSEGEFPWRDFLILGAFGALFLLFFALQGE